MHYTKKKMSQSILENLNILQNEKDLVKFLNSFIIQDKLGEGTFGKVYKIKEKNSKQIYAAKISIHLLEENDAEYKLNLSREVNIISKLNHPCVLKFILYSPINFKKKKKPVIITEYASNKSLDFLLEHERTFQHGQILNDTLKLIIIYGIAIAMSYLHSNDIIHRDLKPENILLDDFFHPKIADFGLSKLNEKNDINFSIREIKGTPKYISPEIWEKLQYTKACDVYAFAIIAFEIMTLERPFADISCFNLMVNISKGLRPEFNKHIPDVYKNLIERCWAEEPNDRPTFDEILIELKTNHEFITKSVDENEFIKFMKFIDNYKISFDSNKYINIEFNNATKKIDSFNNKNIEIANKFQNKIFPFKIYCRLSDESKKLVDDAEQGNINKQYKIGKYFIEGRYDFPQSSCIGKKYLKNSMKKGSKKAFIYYIIMLIKGNILPKKSIKVRKILEKQNLKDDAISLFLYGKLYKSEKNYSESKKYFIQAIQKGSINSIYEYAKLIFNSNKNESIKYYQEAIKKGNKKAMYKYGLILNNNEGQKLIKQSANKGYSKALYYLYSKEPNQVKSIEYLINAAKKSHIQSMHEYGMYLIKNETNKNLTEEELLLYLKKASDKGNFDSMFEYGKIIVEGNKRIQSNPKEGAKYVRIAANNGHADAMGYYGELLQNGEGVSVDYNESIKYLKKGIEKGSGIAMNNYGYAFEYGLGVPLNYEEAIKYYKMAIEKGITVAMNNYAWMLRYGCGVPVNYKEALKYYKMAVDKGDCHSLNGYANMYKLGQGVEVNYEEAIKYYKIAIENGSKAAMTNYAEMLRNGQGVDVNYKEAIRYYQMAIDKGKITPKAMNNYASLLENGEGTEIDYTEAAKYYTMSLNSGYTDAFVNYANMIFRTNQTSLMDKAIEYYKTAINKGSTKSMLSYGLLLYEGKQVKSNKEEGIKFIKMAADGGNCEAKNLYEKICVAQNQ